MYSDSYVTSMLQYADISLYLGATEYEEEKYYVWVDETERLEIIDIIKDVLRYYKPYYLGNKDYDNLVNYLQSLIGKWIQDASIASNNTFGRTVGGITPLPTTTLPFPLQFVVSSSSYIANGQNATSIDSYIGYNILFSRSGIQQSDIITEPSYYTWDRNAGVLIISPAAATGELFQFYAIS